MIFNTNTHTLGIVEVADLVVVNKADGDLIYVARRARGEYRSALHYMRPKYPGVYYPEVVLCSSRRENPMEETKFPVSNVWEKALAFRKVMNEHGLIEEKRQEQRKTWMWKQVNEELVTRLLHGDESTSKFIASIQNFVEKGEMSPRLAADCILQKFLKTHK